MPQPPRRPFKRPQSGKQAGSTARKRASAGAGWDAVAAWYDKLVGESGSDYHRNVILPAAMRLLAPQSGESVVDVCCGQGVLVPHLLAAGIGRLVAVDASRRLVEAAKSRHGADPRVSFTVADVCRQGNWADGSHDAAICLMAVHDVPDVAALFANTARALKPSGRAVFVFMHPCFRIPRHSHWGWDNDQKIQFRRVDRYKSAVEIPIATHPGRESGEQTVFHHRPLADVIEAAAAAGLAVNGCEELYSHRRSQSFGPYSKAEHLAAEEIPMFIALRLARLPG